MPKKEGSTIFLSTETLDILNNLDVDFHGIKMRINSDKVLALCKFYEEHIKSKK